MLRRKCSPRGSTLKVAVLNVYRSTLNFAEHVIDLDNAVADAVFSPSAYLAKYCKDVMDYVEHASMLGCC